MPVATEPLTDIVEIGTARPTMEMLDKQLSELYTREISTESRVFVDKCRAWLETKKGKRGTPAKEICEIEAHNQSTPWLERSLAFDILRALDVNADKVRAFGRAGAFHAFLYGEPDVKPVEFEECTYWLWVLGNGAEIIIATETRLSDKRWSRFAWNDAERGLEGNRWNYLSKGELLALMVNHPSFVELHRLLPSVGDGEALLLWSTILRLSRGYVGCPHKEDRRLTTY